MIDQTTNTLMQSIESPPLTLISKTIAHVFDPIVLIIISILIAAFLYLKVSKKKGIFLALTILITGAAIKLAKEIFGRARPLNALIPETSNALPSGHATIAVVFFGLMIYLFANKKQKTKATITASLIILLIGFTRIYLRVHWLTDVLAGFPIGAIILTTSILIYKNSNLSTSYKPK